MRNDQPTDNRNGPKVGTPSKPTKPKFFLPVASLYSGALSLGRLPEKQGTPRHPKLVRTDWRPVGEVCTVYDFCRSSSPSSSWFVALPLLTIPAPSFRVP